MCSTDLSAPLNRPNLPNTSPFHSWPRYLQPYHRLRLARTASVFLFLSLYMPTRFADTNPSRSTQVIDIKQTFRTVLGFRSPAGYLSTADANTLTRSAHEQFVSKEPPSTERNSIDFSNTGAFRLTLSYKKKHRSRNERASVTDASFFQPEVDPALPSDAAQAKLDCPAMTKALEVPQERASRRKLARMEAQEGPWSVSVADTPYDKNSYSIYIKSEYSTSHFTILPQSFPIKLFSRR